MVICGVELTGNDAVVCLLNLDRGQFSLPETKVRKLSLNRNHTREDLKQFQSAFADLMAEHGVSRVVIKERMLCCQSTLLLIPLGRFKAGVVKRLQERDLTIFVKITIDHRQCGHKVG